MTDRSTWDRRHAAGPPTAPPSAFVERHARRLAAETAGRAALDLACGAGRHARLLRSLGFRTVAVDFSTSALARAAPPGSGILAVTADAEHLPLRESRFDLIVQTCFLERELFPTLARLLRPGGLLVAETFSVTQHDATGHPRREFCLEPGELEQLCERPDVGLETVETGQTSRGPDGAARHLEAILARRP